MVPRFAKPSSMDNARAPRVLAPKACTNVAQSFEENASVECLGMEQASAGRRSRLEGAQREQRVLLLGRKMPDP